jgi:hypothetical protein
MFKEKLQAASIHLGGSMFVVGCFVLYALFVWYPAPFLGISGLLNIILILVSVDLILGPILTFFLYKKGKRGLKFDLAAVILVQLAALGYGMYTVYQGHPVYVAYAADRFTIVTAQDAKTELAKLPEYQVSTLWKPVFAYAQMPSDAKEAQKVLFDALAGKGDIDQLPQYYADFQTNLTTLLNNKNLPYEKLIAKIEYKTLVNDFLAKNQQKPEQLAFIPLSGKENDVIWVWDKSKQQPISVLDINPWKI